ncbi:MAG: DUF4345 family protein [Mariniphaga sp.]|nr:DUF4345 family protein [Mariniphaga sp.]
MAQNKNSLLLKITLIIFAVVALVYGLIYVFVPQVLVEASGSEPVPSGWLRWSGAILVALGIGAIMVLRNPSKQGIFVTTLAIGALFCGLALLYSVLFEMTGIGNIEQTLVPAIINLILSVLFWISLKKSKAILW